MNTTKITPLLPHEDMVQLFDNIWMVTGLVKMPMMMKISCKMTIYRDPETDELTLIEAIRLSEDALKELDKLGKVANVIRLGGFHGRDDAFYRERYGAKIHAIKGQVYMRKLAPPDSKTIAYMEADVWMSDTTDLPIKNAELKTIDKAHPPEGLLLLKQDGGILISADVLQNMPIPDKHMNFMAKFMMKRMGFFHAYNVGPAWLRFSKPSRASIRSILELEFDHVLPSHGEPGIGDAKAKYTPILQGDLKDCHGD